MDTSKEYARLEQYVEIYNTETVHEPSECKQLDRQIEEMDVVQNSTWPGALALRCQMHFSAHTPLSSTKGRYFAILTKDNRSALFVTRNYISISLEIHDLIILY
jgi:hypothetical protein